MTSVTTDRAKYWNARRQPHVSLLVPDGRRQIVVYGQAEILEGKHDNLPEQAFYMVGGIEEAVEKAAQMEAGG